MELDNADPTVPNITELIATAPWHEAVTYRDTWPHEYVVIQKDDNRNCWPPSASASSAVKASSATSSTRPAPTCS